MSEFFSDWLDDQQIDAEPEMDFLFVSPDAFARKPQIGEPRKMTWSMFEDFISKSSIGDAKDIAGGYSPAAYLEHARRKANLLRVWLVIYDIDDGGDVDRVADELATYAAVVHETFNSTNDEPRCRVAIRLAEPVDAATYEMVHAIGRSKIDAALGCRTDQGAKDASRLSYCPVRRAGAGYRVRVNRGRPLDAKRVIAAHPPKPVVRPPVEVKPEHADKYRQAALRRAADAILSASVGARHEVLNKEAYALARLDLSRDEIADALLPAFVSAAGEARRYEAVRTIADAVRARKGAA